MTFIGQNYLREQAGADDRYKASTKAQLEKMKTLLYQTKKYLLTGDMPSLIDVGEGCRFCSRCSFRKDICESTQPQLKDMGDGHYVACHFAGEINF